MKKHQSLYLFFFFLLILQYASTPLQATSPEILTVEIDGTIDQSTLELLTAAYDYAENEDIDAIILTLNTPGGGLDQTFAINDLIYNSDIPIIGYVYPAGSTAWSAGTFILLSTPIAAMAEDTIIGSCQPVQITATGTEYITENKTINALVEYLTVRAERYNRNTTLAEEFIRKNTNVDENQALQSNVIDYIATSPQDLLNQLDNTTVVIQNNTITLHTKNATITAYQTPLQLQLFKLLNNPLLSSVLFTVGILALFVGLSSPGLGAEVFGGIAILLGLVGMGFTMSLIAIVIIAIGCLLLLAELFLTPGFGILGIGGIICFSIGSIFLIPTYLNGEWLINSTYTTDLMLIMLGIAIMVSVFFGFLLYKILEIRKKRPSVNIYIGETAETLDPISPQKPGYILYHGEYWKATSNEDIPAHTTVTITDKHNQVLTVTKKTATTTDTKD